MAYDQTLAQRIRDHLASQPDLTEKKMFGGIAFIINGNVAVGISKDSLMLRVGLDNYESTLQETGVAVFDKTGSPMRGWVLVSPSRFETEDELGRWINRGVAFALTLPPK